MINKLKLTLRGALFTAALAGMSAGSLADVPDVLDAPSMKSALSSQSLLLDVVRAGTLIVAVGERGHVIYSEDGGVRWDQADVPVSTTLTGVYFVNPQKGWAVGHSGVVIATTDGGRTWTKQLDGNRINSLLIARLEAAVSKMQKTVEQAGDASRERLETQLEETQFALEDAQANADSGPANPLLDVWFANEKLGFVVGAYGMILKTEDGGQTWVDWSDHIENPDRFHINAIAQVTGGSLFLAGEGGLLATSADGGRNWKMLEGAYDGSLFGITGTGNVNEVLVFGLRGNIFRSVDLGRSWKAVSHDSQSSLMGAVSNDSGELFLVGNGGAVLVSNNAGESFRSNVRHDNLALTAVTLLPDNTLVLVGESGAMRAGPNGQNLE